MEWKWMAGDGGKRVASEGDKKAWQGKVARVDKRVTRGGKGGLQGVATEGAKGILYISSNSLAWS